MTRREALLGLLLVGCGGAPPKPASPPLPPLHLRPVSDLAAAAALSWIVDARPRALFANPELVVAVRELFPDARFETFASRHGGVDPRQLDQLVVASYPESTLFLAAGVIDAAKVEAAFVARARAIEGRGIDRKSDALGTIVRTWGVVNEEREQIAIFGREAIGLEIGKLGPLRAAEAFAQGKLRKASPALRAPPLAAASALLAESPLRVFAPGPFEGDAKNGLGGLLGASTAAAVAADPLDEDKLRLRVALLGAWTAAEAEAAKGRLAAALQRVSSSAIGKLCGLDQPVAGPTVALRDDALIAETVIRMTPLFRGLHAATGASVDEIMRY